MSERTYVIGYDIICARRLQRAHRVMTKYATPIERSVYLLTGSEDTKSRCLIDLAKVILPSQDDVRCYPLPSRGLKKQLGKPSLPAGIFWSGLALGLNAAETSTERMLVKQQ